MTADSSTDGLLLTADMVTVSRVDAAAQASGLKVEIVDDIASVTERAADVRFVLVDLACPGLSVTDLVTALPTDTRPQIIAWAAHVHTGRLDAARAAGCDQVLSRGGFFAQLTDILAGFSEP